MNNDKHLINETEYAACKKRALSDNNDFMLAAAMGAFEGIVDRFTELADANDELDIYKLIYKFWNGVAKKSGYFAVDEPIRLITNYYLAKHWLYGDVFVGMVRDGEIKGNGKCIGHSLDGNEW